jgi:bacterial/archaeal transporter family protein
LNITTAIMIAVITLATSLGELFIAKGIREIGEISTLRLSALIKIALKIMTNKFFMLGIFLMAVSFFTFLATLTNAPLSLVVPATAISFAIKTFGAKILLKERINRERLIGTLLVCLGVALISLPE